MPNKIVLTALVLFMGLIYLFVFEDEAHVSAIKARQSPLEPQCIAFDITSHTEFEEGSKPFEAQGTIALYAIDAKRYRGTFRKQSSELYAPFSIKLDENRTIIAIEHGDTATLSQIVNTASLIYEINDLLKTFPQTTQRVRENRYALGTFSTLYTPVERGLRRIQQAVTSLPKQQTYSTVEIIHSDAFLALDEDHKVKHIIGTETYDVTSRLMPFSTEISYAYRKIPIDRCDRFEHAPKVVATASDSAPANVIKSEPAELSSRLQSLFENFETGERQKSKRELIEWIKTHSDELELITDLFETLPDSIRMNLFNAMELADTPASASWLFAFASDPSYEKRDRLRAVFGMSGLNEGVSEHYLETLYEYYAECDDAEIATSILYAIGGIGKHDANSLRAIGLLELQLQSATAPLQTARSITALANTQNPEAVEQLYPYAHSDDATVKAALYKALTSVPPTQSSKTLLMDALVLDTAESRTQALHSLTKMRLNQEEALKVMRTIESDPSLKNGDGYLEFLYQYRGLDREIDIAVREEQLKQVRERMP